MREELINHSQQDICSAICITVEQLKWTLSSQSDKKDFFLIEYAGSFLSYGNKIEIKIQEIRPDSCKISISSRSAALIQIVDWDTNKRLEDKLYNTILKVISQ